MKRLLPAVVCLIALGAMHASSLKQAGAGELDRIVAAENKAAEVKLAPLPVVDDAAFLRRIYVDLIGRIPTEGEVREFAAAPAKTRRAELIDKLLQDERFADRWTLFYADMLRLRSNAVGGSALMAWVHNAIKTGMPYDEMCQKLIASNGKAGRVPEAGFVLADDADPLAMASITAQVFLGVRIGCAQCHDHPFDVWSRRQFYDLAAFYGKTKRYESQLTRVVFATEGEQSTVLWPPEGEGNAADRKAIPPKFPFDLEAFTAKPDHIKRLEQVRAEKLAALKPKDEDQGPSVDDLLAESSEKVDKTTSGKLAAELALAEAKQDIRKIDITKGMFIPSEQREELARSVTDPRNKLFSQALANRVWKTLVGRGFVEPVDDFRGDNPASHAKALDYLAKEFVASDFDLRSLVRVIVTSDAYQRAHAPLDIDQPTRATMEEHLLATPVRRMIAESLYDSVVTAGHLFEPKHSPGKNEKTVYDIVRVLKGGKPGDLTKGGSPLSNKKPAMTAMAGKPMTAAGYELEGAIELDFNALLEEQGDDEEVALDEMKAMSKEEIEAARMAQQRMMREGSTDYEEKKVARTIDDNPVFNTSLRMQSPAPDGHFLRIFGQPNRTELGDLRDDTASMRQALMMLNGRITHEAARVGDLEPMNELLTGKKQNLDEAVKFAYVEILTRRPTAEELAEGKEIVQAASSSLEGMADLRWVLLNCNEFRFLP